MGIMGLFPDDFPFTRREPEAAAQEPIVEAQPLASGAFPDDFPFNTKREAQAAPAAVAEAREQRPSAIFPPGFPFSDPEPLAPAAVENIPQATAAAPVAEMSAIAPAPAPVAPLPFKDRRRSPRQRMHAKASLRVDTVAGNPLHVEIENLSLLGVRFRTGRELLINDKANIRLEIGPLKWNARLRVINCLQCDGATYLIGCEFVGNELARGRAAA
jgi:hypothetical protein